MLGPLRSTHTRIASLALALAGCYAAPKAVSEPIQVDPRIELELREPGRWRATYHLEQPAETLRFWRSAQWFRESTWTVLSPGYTLARDGNSQILTATNGTNPTDTIAVEISTWPEAMNGEFRPMLAFSDGSLALFTGHLYLRDVASELAGDDAPYLQTLRVTVPANTTVAISGTVLEAGETTSWTDPHGAGTYVYFSSPRSEVEPFVREDMIAILDPSLAPAVQAEIQRMLSRVLELLARRLDAPLPWRPMILVAWEPSRSGARQWEGGARPGIIYMSLAGDWDLDEPEVMIELAHFVGHEASHFWNGALIQCRTDDAWLHEGSADALADLLLHQLELIDAEMLRVRQERAVNRCLALLNGSALRDAEAEHGRGVHYPCGYLMAIWSDAAVGSPDLFAIWASLIDQVGDAGEYDAASYFAVLRRMGADPALLEQMEIFLDSAIERRARLVDGFGRAGLSLTSVERPPVDERVRLAAEALVHLQRATCGQTSVTSMATRHKLHPLAGCEPFTSEVEIHGIAGHAVVDGDRAHDAVRRGCASGHSIALTGPNDEVLVRVRCDQPLTERPTWLRLDQSTVAPRPE